MGAKSFYRSSDLVNNINNKLISNNLINPKDRVLFSFSGGQDSICLLFILNQFYSQLELTLTLFWCHHRWQTDSFYLMQQVAKLSFLFQFNSCFAISSNFISSELLARKWRQSCGYRVSLFYNYSKICLAHTSNDKVETIFVHFMRGTALTGLSSTQLIAKPTITNEKHISQYHYLNYLSLKPNSSNICIPSMRDSFNYLTNLTVVREFINCPVSDSTPLVSLLRKPSASDSSCRQTKFCIEVNRSVKAFQLFTPQLRKLKGLVKYLEYKSQRVCLCIPSKSSICVPSPLCIPSFGQDASPLFRRTVREAKRGKVCDGRGGLRPVRRKECIADWVREGVRYAKEVERVRTEVNKFVIAKKTRVQLGQIFDLYRKANKRLGLAEQAPQPAVKTLRFVTAGWNYTGIVRPLLSISRFETNKICLFWKLPIYPDTSNQKDKFLRNLVRQQLLPTIKFSFRSNLENIFFQFAEIVEIEDYYFTQRVNQFAKNVDVYDGKLRTHFLLRLFDKKDKKNIVRSKNSLINKVNRNVDELLTQLIEINRFKNQIFLLYLPLHSNNLVINKSVHLVYKFSIFNNWQARRICFTPSSFASPASRAPSCFAYLPSDAKHEGAREAGDAKLESLYPKESKRYVKANLIRLTNVRNKAKSSAYPYVEEVRYAKEVKRVRNEICQFAIAKPQLGKPLLPYPFLLRVPRRSKVNKKSETEALPSKALLQTKFAQKFLSLSTKSLELADDLSLQRKAFAYTKGFASYSFSTQPAMHSFLRTGRKPLLPSLRYPYGVSKASGYNGMQRKKGSGMQRKSIDFQKNKLRDVKLSKTLVFDLSTLNISKLKKRSVFCFLPCRQKKRKIETVYFAKKPTKIISKNIKLISFVSVPPASYASQALKGSRLSGAKPQLRKPFQGLACIAGWEYATGNILSNTTRTANINIFQTNRKSLLFYFFDIYLPMYLQVKETKSINCFTSQPAFDFSDFIEKEQKSIDLLYPFLLLQIFELDSIPSYYKSSSWTASPFLLRVPSFGREARRGKTSKTKRGLLSNSKICNSWVCKQSIHKNLATSLIESKTEQIIDNKDITFIYLPSCYYLLPLIKCYYARDISFFSFDFIFSSLSHSSKCKRVDNWISKKPSISFSYPDTINNIWLCSLQNTNTEIKDLYFFKFFIYFFTFTLEKRPIYQIYLPNRILCLPLVFQRRLVKFFLLKQNKKNIRYSIIEKILTMS